MLNEAEEYDLKFVVNFVLRDYDALWEAIGSPDDLLKVWKDPGILMRMEMPVLHSRTGITGLIKMLWNYEVIFDRAKNFGKIF